jgi:hypothetical protein
MQILNRRNVSYLDRELLSNGLLIVKNAIFYKGIPQEDLAIWCHGKGIYGLPTTELIEWLKEHVIPGKTIEVGAGIGAIGRTLGIPITDSCVMERPDVKLYYQMGGQPVTEYPFDIVRLSAVDAIKKLKPSVVIGCWVTQIYKEEDGPTQDASVFGLDEEFILDNVDKYIVIGNKKVHDKKRIMTREYDEHRLPWLFSRSLSVDDNVVYIWEL